MFPRASFVVQEAGMDRRGSWEAAPPPPPVAALKRGAVLHGQLVSLLAFLPGNGFLC